MSLTPSTMAAPVFRLTSCNCALLKPPQTYSTPHASLCRRKLATEGVTSLAVSSTVAPGLPIASALSSLRIKCGRNAASGRVSLLPSKRRWRLRGMGFSLRLLMKFRTSNIWGWGIASNSLSRLPSVLLLSDADVHDTCDISTTGPRTKRQRKFRAQCSSPPLVQCTRNTLRTSKLFPRCGFSKRTHFRQVSARGSPNCAGRPLSERLCCVARRRSRSVLKIPSSSANAAMARRVRVTPYHSKLIYPRQ